MVAKELSELKRRFVDLAAKIEKRAGASRARQQLTLHIRGLHGPTITALSDAPPLVFNGKSIIADIHYFRTGLPEKLDNADRLSGPEAMFWANLANAAGKVPHKVQAVGRTPDRHAQIVANALARKYFVLTQTEPTFATAAGNENEGEVYGPYLDFVGEIFMILNIRAVSCLNESMGIPESGEV